MSSRPGCLTRVAAQLWGHTLQASVVIPTMGLANSYLVELVEMYQRHPLVGEVLLINNADVDLPVSGPRVREIHRGANLFVNPSWNLGVAQARFGRIILSNDDLRISATAVTWGLLLTLLPVGLVGPHTSAQRQRGRGVLWALPAYERTPVFGTLMLGVRDRFVPIPDDLLIFAGDDYLFGAQRHRNVWIGGFSLQTPMGVTSRRPEYTAQKDADVAAFNAHHRYELGYYARFAREVRLAQTVRMLVRERLRPIVRRLTGR